MLQALILKDLAKGILEANPHDFIALYKVYERREREKSELKIYEVIYVVRSSIKEMCVTTLERGLYTSNSIRGYVEYAGNYGTINVLCIRFNHTTDTVQCITEHSLENIKATIDDINKRTKPAFLKDKAA